MRTHRPRKGVELFREDDAYLVVADLAEYDRDTIGCDWEDGVVTIEAGSAMEPGPEPFRREIGLPARAGAADIDVSMREGVLEVTVPLGDAT